MCIERMSIIEQNSARLATLDQLLKTIIPAYLTPPPGRETLREWFDAVRIPRFKANPTARRGGGPVYYSVAAVEKFLQSRTLPCRLPSALPATRVFVKSNDPIE